ncbi:MAG: hypothetical protein ACU0CI_11645, partial [Shimia sp.]
KAAVAATHAARSMGEDAADADPAGAYREDLAQVVASSPRDRSAPAPLTLVAEQRVGQPAESREPDVAPPSDPVVAPAAQRRANRAANASGERPRPRAVEPARSADTSEPARHGRARGDFQAFAQDVGAQSVPDMLQAAAAYVTHVEGSNVFSRPKVMRMVKDGMGDGAFTREDGLRAFGTLLRKGRIEKLRGGEFRVTDATGFVDEARALRRAS